MNDADEKHEAFLLLKGTQQNLYHRIFRDYQEVVV